MTKKIEEMKNQISKLKKDKLSLKVLFMLCKGKNRIFAVQSRKITCFK